jgi:hypothetical protein
MQTWFRMFFITLSGPKAHDNSVEKHFQDESAEPQIPPLRSPGRDDKGEVGGSIEEQLLSRRLWPGKAHPIIRKLNRAAHR